VQDVEVRIVTRVELIADKSRLAAEHHKIFDMIAESRGEVAGPFPLLLHDPKLAEAIASLGTHIRFGSPLSAAEQKILTLVVASETGSRYLTDFHTPLARKLGIAESFIRAVLDKDDVGGADAVLVVYARKLLRAEPVDAALFDALHKRFGTAGLTMLTATVGYYAMLAYIMNAFDLAG
jgi:4-carboxymuconolactone decarboxylase